MDPSEVSKSRTFVSNVELITVSIEDSVKHAKNRPFGANVISTMGDEIRARQSRSFISAVAALTTTTELSFVERKTSGCLEAVFVRGSTAMAANERKLSLAKAAVGRCVISPQKGGIESLAAPPPKSVET